MTPTKAQVAENWALTILNLEALRPRAEGDAALEAEVGLLQKLAAAALKESASARESK